MADGICTIPGCGKKLLARGLCEPHYRKELRGGMPRKKQRYTGECSADGCTEPDHARGLCSTHYGMWRRTGDPNAPHQRIGGGRTCTVQDCGERANADGLCSVHYRRQKRTGSTGAAFERATERACHYCTEAFSSPNLSKLYCSEECARTGKSLREAFARYGITMQQYRTLWLRQNGVCAICGQPERSERNRLLTIDHDHVSGHVRGLLCSHCNRAIGLLQDDPKVIRSAADYVQRTRQIALLI